MKTLATIAGRFREEEDGAAMIEYSILIGLIAVAAIGFVIGIGGWVTGRFTDLCTNLNGVGGGTCADGAGS